MAHPEGPYSYSDWSGIPDNVEYRANWFKYLALYKPMVEENSVCHMNVTDSTITRTPLPKHVYMSLFTGDEQYLCISNLTKETQTVALTHLWKNRETGSMIDTVTLGEGELAFLQRI